MSELKVYHCNEWHNEYTEFYLKYEADKVIADLEESHKKEVGQLLMEIVKLKEKHKTEVKELRHHKYKRCLDKAERCKISAQYNEHLGAFGFSNWYWKWNRRWLELAEKLKEVK